MSVPIKGRRTTDYKPTVRSISSYDETLSDIASAWNTMGQAKNLLTRNETKMSTDNNFNDSNTNFKIRSNMEPRIDLVTGKCLRNLNGELESNTNIRYLNDTPNSIIGENQGLNLSDDHLSILHQRIQEQRRVTSKKMHSDEELVQPKVYELYENENNSAKIRKVAVSTHKPVYKGFSEPVKLAVKRSASGAKKPARPKLSRDFGPDDLEMKTVKKPSRITSKGKSDKTDLITTNCWREGRQIVKDEIGPPPRLQKDKDVTLNKLSNEARSVLEDLKPKIYQNSKPIQLKRLEKIKEFEQTKDQPKVKHYDAKQVQDYIKKQKNERKKQLELEQEERNKLQQAKLKQLQEIYRKQKESFQLNNHNIKKSQADNSKSNLDHFHETVVTPNSSGSSSSNSSHVDNLIDRYASNHSSPKSTANSVEDLIKKYASPTTSVENIPVVNHNSMQISGVSSKKDRLAALCKTASELQKKLKMEVNKIDVFINCKNDLTIPDSAFEDDAIRKPYVNTTKNIDEKNLNGSLDIPGIKDMRSIASLRYASECEYGNHLSQNKNYAKNTKEKTFSNENMGDYDVDEDTTEYYKLSPNIGKQKTKLNFPTEYRNKVVAGDTTRPKYTTFVDFETKPDKYSVLNVLERQKYNVKKHNIKDNVIEEDINDVRNSILKENIFDYKTDDIPSYNDGKIQISHANVHKKQENNISSDNLRQQVVNSVSDNSDEIRSVHDDISKEEKLISDDTITNTFSDNMSCGSEASFTLSDKNATVGRYSPSTLEQRFRAELELLHGVDIHCKQMESVENLRGIATSQQESVALAQLLKSQEISHSQKMAEFELQAQRHKFDSERLLNESRFEHEKSLENVKRASKQDFYNGSLQMCDIFKEQLERSAKLQERVIDSVNEVARSSATSAVSAALDHLQPKTIEKRLKDQSAQYSKNQTSLTSNDVSSNTYSESFVTEKSKQLINKKVKQSVIQDDSSLTEEYAATKSSLSEFSDDVKYSTKSSKSISENITNKSSANSSDTSFIEECISDNDADKTPEIKSKSFYSSSKQMDDYPVDIDYSMAERSFSEVLPSKEHYDSVIHSLSDVSSTSFHDSVKHDNDVSATFSTSGSFAAFNAKMFKQYLTEEELRSNHQLTLLKLREKAVQEKMKAELEWQKTQTQSRKDRRADDPYPKKRSRSVLLSLEQEKAEIERRKIEMKQASIQRRLLLKGLRAEKLWHLSRQTERKRRSNQLTNRKVSKLTAEKEISNKCLKDDDKYKVTDESIEDESVAKESDNSRQQTPPNDNNLLNKLKKFKIHEKQLTKREQKLKLRRQQAEELLKWKNRLDEEEKTISALEREALTIYNDKKSTHEKVISKSSKYSKNNDNVESESILEQYSNNHSIVSENISYSESFQESASKINQVKQQFEKRRAHAEDLERKNKELINSIREQEIKNDLSNKSSIKSISKSIFNDDAPNTEYSSNFTSTNSKHDPKGNLDIKKGLSISEPVDEEVLEEFISENGDTNQSSNKIKLIISSNVVVDEEDPDRMDTGRNIPEVSESFESPIESKITDKSINQEITTKSYIHEDSNIEESINDLNNKNESKNDDDNDKNSNDSSKSIYSTDSRESDKERSFDNEKSVTETPTSTVSDNKISIIDSHSQSKNVIKSDEIKSEKSESKIEEIVELQSSGTDEKSDVKPLLIKDIDDESVRNDSNHNEEIVLNNEKEIKEADNIVHNVLQEAITSMLIIRKNKLTNFRKSFENIKADFDTDTLSPVVNNVVETIDKKDKKSVAKSKIETLDDIYAELGTITGDDYELMDWGWDKTLPSYTPPLVPTTIEGIEEIADEAINLLWSFRRCGQNFEDISEIPESFLKNKSSVAKTAYRKLVFDVTKSILIDMYEDENEPTELPVYIKRSNIRISRKLPPTALETIRPIVIKNVSSILNPNKILDSAISIDKRKMDYVDIILKNELREEEPEWVNYDDDELVVKMNVTDAIFDLLMLETTKEIGKIAKRKSGFI